MFSTVFKSLIFFLVLFSFADARDIDLDSALQKANKSQKHLFVFLHQTDCGYCESMRQFTFEDEVIKQFIKDKFVYEHINVKEQDVVTFQDFKGNGRDFAKHIGYNFYPTSLFFDKDGELAFVEVGYIDKKDIPNETRFYEILKYVDLGLYKKMDFNVSK